MNDNQEQRKNKREVNDNEGEKRNMSACKKMRGAG